MNAVIDNNTLEKRRKLVEQMEAGEVAQAEAEQLQAEICKLAGFPGPEHVTTLRLARADLPRLSPELHDLYSRLLHAQNTSLTGTQAKFRLLDMPVEWIDRKMDDIRQGRGVVIQEKRRLEELRNELCSPPSDAHTRRFVSSFRLGDCQKALRDCERRLGELSEKLTAVAIRKLEVDPQP